MCVCAYVCVRERARASLSLSLSLSLSHQRTHTHTNTPTHTQQFMPDCQCGIVCVCVCMFFCLFVCLFVCLCEQVCDATACWVFMCLVYDGAAQLEGGDGGNVVLKLSWCVHVCTACSGVGAGAGAGIKQAFTKGRERSMLTLPRATGGGCLWAGALDLGCSPSPTTTHLIDRIFCHTQARKSKGTSCVPPPFPLRPACFPGTALKHK